MNFQGPETLITHITFGPDGKLSPDSEAQGAIKSIADCTCQRRIDGTKAHRIDCDHVAEVLTELEARYEMFAYPNGKPGLRTRLAWFFGAVPLNIFRREIGLLARAYQKATAELRARDAQESFNGEYLRLRENERLLRRFVMDNFPDAIDVGVAEEKPLLATVKEVLLKAKAGAL